MTDGQWQELAVASLIPPESSVPISYQLRWTLFNGRHLFYRSPQGWGHQSKAYHYQTEKSAQRTLTKLRRSAASRRWNLKGGVAWWDTDREDQDAYVKEHFSCMAVVSVVSVVLDEHQPLEDFLRVLAKVTPGDLGYILHVAADKASEDTI